MLSDLGMPRTFLVDCSLQPEMKASIMVLNKILQDKLNDNYRNLGTLGPKRPCLKQSFYRTQPFAKRPRDD